MPPDELDLDGDGKKSGPNKVILIVVAVLLIGATVGGTMYFTGFFDEKETKEDAAEAVPALPDTFYLSLGPEFIVNFSGDQPVNYMQISISIMSRYQHFITVAESNLPRIRNEILVLLSSQQYSELRTKDGKEKLRQAILEKLRTIVISTNPTAPSIEKIYFTHFIMQ